MLTKLKKHRNNVLLRERVSRFTTNTGKGGL